MGVVLTLWRKELVDALRDRRTLAMMVLVPVLLYPLMLLAIGAMTLAGKDRLAKEPLKVALIGAEARALLPDGRAPKNTTFVLRDRKAAEAEIQEGKTLAAAVEVPDGSAARIAQGEQAPVTLLYTKRHDRSMEAEERMDRVLTAMGAEVTTARLAEKGLPATFAKPLAVESYDLAFQKNVGPLIASRMLPMLMLMMLFLGSFYASVDVTAGEKERGTLETLLVAPIRPGEVMAGKYLAVATLAVITSLMNLGSMAITFRIGIQMGEGLSASIDFTTRQVVTILVGLLPSSLMVSAISLAVASLARTFKEGQSLLTPLLMVGMLPGMAAQMPGIELTAVTAAVPLLNVALLIRAAILGPVSPGLLVIATVSVVGCGLLAVRMAANAFQSEAIRFGGAESWRDLFRLREG